jgi:hypothetical protein
VWLHVTESTFHSGATQWAQISSLVMSCSRMLHLLSCTREDSLKIISHAWFCVAQSTVLYLCTLLLEQPLYAVQFVHHWHGKDNGYILGWFRGVSASKAI